MSAADWCAVGVSYLQPAEADRLLQAAQESQEAPAARRRGQCSRVLDAKHQQFINDLLYAARSTVC